MDNYVIKNAKIELYKGNEKTVEIPKGIKQICEEAFSNSSVEHVCFVDNSLKIKGEYK